MTATIPTRDSGPMATHLLADADQQNYNLRRSFRSRPAGQLWEREYERDAAAPSCDEFEAPEADPAEADPAEAEEAMPSLICPLHGAGCEAWA